MSSGQRQRTPANFPRMKARARKRWDREQNFALEMIIKASPPSDDLRARFAQVFETVNKAFTTVGTSARLTDGIIDNLIAQLRVKK